MKHVHVRTVNTRTSRDVQCKLQCRRKQVEMNKWKQTQSQRSEINMFEVESNKQVQVEIMEAYRSQARKHTGVKSE